MCVKGGGGACLRDLAPAPHLLLVQWAGHCRRAHRSRETPAAATWVSCMCCCVRVCMERPVKLTAACLPAAAVAVTVKVVCLSVCSHLVQVQAHTLACRCCAKDPGYWHAVHCSTLEARERDIQARDGRGLVVIQGHDAQAEERAGGLWAAQHWSGSGSSAVTTLHPVGQSAHKPHGECHCYMSTESRSARRCGT